MKYTFKDILDAMTRIIYLIVIVFVIMYATTLLTRQVRAVYYVELAQLYQDFALEGIRVGKPEIVDSMMELSKSAKDKALAINPEN